MKRILANQDEINLYTNLGEALFITQTVEQALSHSITLKLNADSTTEDADEALKKNLRYTLGQAIVIANKEKLYNLEIQKKLDVFLEKRNWLVHNVICGNEESFNAGKIPESLLNKISSICDEARIIHRDLEYDLLDFCRSKGKDMSKLRALLELQDKGIRIRKVS